MIISNILFQAENRQAVAREAFRVLKAGGKAAVIEWNSEVKIGPLAEKRLSKEDVKKIFLAEGFLPDRNLPAGESHYGIMFKKQ